MRIAIGAALGGQFLPFVSPNWQARAGRSGSHFTFPSDGRALWPE